MAPCKSLFCEPRGLDVSLSLFFPHPPHVTAREGHIRSYEKNSCSWQGVSSFLSESPSGSCLCPGTRLPSKNNKERAKDPTKGTVQGRQTYFQYNPWLLRREGWHAWPEHQQWLGLEAHRNKSDPVRGCQGQGPGKTPVYRPRSGEHFPSVSHE